jgi:hypothetical protein
VITARARLGLVQRVLVLTALMSALLWAGAAAALVLALGALADLAVGIPSGPRRALPVVAAMAAIAAAGLILWRARGVRRRERVALWVEERVPALRYALVTSLDPASESNADALDAQAGAVRFEPAAWRAAGRSVLVSAMAALGAVLLLAMLPGGVVARVTTPRAGDVLSRPTGTPEDALAAVAVTVEPPAYTRLPTETLEDPVRVPAVVGSRLRIEGRVAEGTGPTGGRVVAEVGGRAVEVGLQGTRWRVATPMPATAEVVRLRQNARERLLLLEPRGDSVPVVILERPVRDTVLRAPTGVLPLAAHFRDDFGLSEGWWELVVSSGEGENFKFRSMVVGRAGFANARIGDRGWRLVLDSLGLAPGDLVHVRAVGRDGNTVTGPGIGGSDTRTIRIARASEYDSLAVEGLPPADTLTAILSQRMIILLTEALEKKRPRIPREELVAESRRIAVDQNALRRQVGDIIFSRLEDLGGEGEHSHDDGHDHGALSPDDLLKAAEEATAKAGAEPLDFAEGESPVVAINRPLLEAYNAMWDASRELGVADPRRALPHMYAALAAIQRARLAERFYLRGRTREVVVDLAKVRLAGKKDGIGPGARAPRTSEDLARARRAERFDAAIAELADGRMGQVLDSLLLLRAELIGADPAAAAPLGDAIDALRAGRDATPFLVSARRALAGAPVAAGGLGSWSPLP